MRTGMFKKFTQRIPLINLEKRQVQIERIIINIPIEIWRKIREDARFLKQDKVEGSGYLKREKESLHVEKDVINSILAYVYDTGGIDFVDTEDVTKDA